MERHWFNFKMWLGTWNPIKLRRYLKNARNAIDANANGWANTHMELVTLKEYVRQLESERDQWQRQVMSSGH